MGSQPRRNTIVSLNVAYEMVEARGFPVALNNECGPSLFLGDMRVAVAARRACGWSRLGARHLSQVHYETTEGALGQTIAGVLGLRFRRGFRRPRRWRKKKLVDKASFKNTGKAAKGVARPCRKCPASGGMTDMQDLLLAFQQEFGLALE